jgi:PEP-CTERM motif-containing protein
MSDKPISPLRQRMIDDMTARRFSEKVQKALQGGFLTAGALQINSGGTLNQSDGSASITANAANAGTLTITGGTFSTGADFINTGTVAVTGASSVLDVGAKYSQSGSGSPTVLNGGTLDPPAIAISAGVFGGAGTVVGDVSVTGGNVQVGTPQGALHVEGAYSQTGGTINFDIDPNGRGGFLESDLLFDPSDSVAITSTKIVFDFLNGASALAFFASGAFNLDAFFQESDGSLFSSDFNLPALFADDAFATNMRGFDISAISASGSVDLTQSSTVPEPSSWVMLLLGFAGVGLCLVPPLPA